MRTPPPPPKNDRLAFEKKAEAGRSHSCPSSLKQVMKARKGVLPSSWRRLRDPPVISAWSVPGGKGILISEDTGTQITICTGLANFLQVYYQWVMPIAPHPHLSITECFIRLHSSCLKVTMWCNIRIFLIIRVL